MKSVLCVPRNAFHENNILLRSSPLVVWDWTRSYNPRCLHNLDKRPDSCPLRDISSTLPPGPFPLCFYLFHVPRDVEKRSEESNDRREGQRQNMNQKRRTLHLRPPWKSDPHKKHDVFDVSSAQFFSPAEFLRDILSVRDELCEEIRSSIQSFDHEITAS